MYVWHLVLRHIGVYNLFICTLAFHPRTIMQQDFCSFRNLFIFTLPLQALYSYDAQDTDELSFSADDVIEIVKEGNVIIF